MRRGCPQTRRTYSNARSIRATLQVRGARGGTRTRMPLRAMDFESIEYADFSTRAGGRRVAEVRTREEVALVLELVAMGRNDCEIAREAGIPRSTVRQWRKGQTPDFDRRYTFKGPDGQPRRGACVVCGGDPLTLPQASYTYLLGLYLGDGCLTACPRNVYKLRIACAERYWEVYSFSKHWPCLFPQHGPGRKHERKIELTPWQQELVDLDPRPLVRGLLHSDGCRVLNWVNGTPYPRYHFSNVSADIRGIFGRACDQLGIEWRPNNRWSLSVARRGSVALLDEFVGSKQ